MLKWISFEFEFRETDRNPIAVKFVIPLIIFSGIFLKEQRNKGWIPLVQGNAQWREIC
jgi:hypothetical protein